MPSPRGATGRALSNPMLQTPQGPSSKPPTRAAPPAEAATRRRRGTLAAGKHVLGPPVARAATAVLGANIPRAKPGNIVSMHWSSTCEGLTRGDLGCAGHLQPDESLFG